MNASATESRLSVLLADLFACDPAMIRSDAKLRAIGLDSMRAFELVILVEDAFGVKFQTYDLDTLKGATVADLASYVDRLRLVR